MIFFILRKLTINFYKIKKNNLRNWIKIKIKLKMGTIGMLRKFIYYYKYKKGL